MIEQNRWHGMFDSAIGELQDLLEVNTTCRADEQLYELVKNLTFEFGEKNSLILWLQNRLKAMGHYTYYPNGTWDKFTINSIYKLQKRHDVKCGEIDSTVWYLLLKG